MQKKKAPKISLSVLVMVAAISLLAGIAFGWVLFGKGRLTSNPPNVSGTSAGVNEPVVSAETLGFSGVIIGVGADRLVVYVSHGVAAGTNVTLFITPDTVLEKTIAKTDQELAAETNYAAKTKNWDSSKGLPPPLDPVDNPYKTLPIKVSDLVPDDVADFTAVGDPASGQLTAKSVTWIWHMDRVEPTLNK